MRRRTGQEGATAVEYAIMLALVAAVIIVLVVLVGRQTCEGYAGYTQEVEAAASPVVTTPGGSCPT